MPGRAAAGVATPARAVTLEVSLSSAGTSAGDPPGPPAAAAEADAEPDAGEPPGTAAPGTDTPGTDTPGDGAPPWLPDEDFVGRWARRAVDAALDPTADAAAAAGALPAGDAPLALELSVHLADARTSRALNREHRGRDRATNVLSFPSGLPPLEVPHGGTGTGGGTLVVLGDLVPCPEVIRREAIEQGKDERAHWAHLVVHGTLHLLGLDHEDEGSAASMEAVEIRLLSAAGLPDPYGAPPDETRA